MKIIIQEIINHYIENIFNGKHFRNEINPSLGRTDIILSKIPNEIIQNPEIPQTKLKEINDMVSDEIKKAVDLFNKKRDELPLFEEILSIKEKICNQISDEKIKELMSKFYYAEDKIPFYKDNFYSLLKNNEKISFKIPQNNREFNNMINRVSEKKAYEYNEILVPKRPKWNKIKKEMKLKIQSECDEFYKKVMTNKFYKEDVKFDMNQLEHSINNLNLYNGILPNKYKEINGLINEMKETTKNKINNAANSLSKWEDRKLILIQIGYSIMEEKSNSDLNTKDYNQIINILLNEVLDSPQFLDSCKNENQTNEIIEELNKKAKQLSNNYINKKNEEERKKREYQELLNKQRQENERILREQKERFEREKIEQERLLREAREREARERAARERAEREARERATRQSQYFPRTPYGGVSIVDGLKAIGSDSSYNYRSAIAARHGIQGYVGSPAQNTHMLNLLKNGQLLRP